MLFAWYKQYRDTEVRQWAERALDSGHGSELQRARVAVVLLTLLVVVQADEPARVESLSALAASSLSGFDAEWHRRWVVAQVERERLAGQYEAALAWTEHQQPAGFLESTRVTMLRCSLLAQLDRWEQMRIELTGRLGDEAMAEHPRQQAYALAVLGLAETLLGDLDAAERDLDRAAAIADSDDLPMHRVVVNSHRIWLSLDRDRPVEALRQADQLLSDAHSAQQDVWLLEATVGAGLALAALGSVPDAVALAAAARLCYVGRPELLDAHTRRRFAALTALADDQAPPPDPVPVAEVKRVVAHNLARYDDTGAARGRSNPYGSGSTH